MDEIITVAASEAPKTVGEVSFALLEELRSLRNDIQVSRVRNTSESKLTIPSYLGRDIREGFTRVELAVDTLGVVLGPNPPSKPGRSSVRIRDKKNGKEKEKGRAEELVFAPYAEENEDLGEERMQVESGPE